MVGAVPIRTFFHPLFPQPADQSFTNPQKDSLIVLYTPRIIYKSRKLFISTFILHYIYCKSISEN